MTDKIKFFYFDSFGRGEQVRCLLRHAKVPFEDVRFTNEQWGAQKKSGKFEYEQVPSLEFNGKMFTQTPAIMHFLATKYKYIPEDPMLSYQVISIYYAAVDVFNAYANWNYMIQDPKLKEAAKAEYFSKTVPFMFGKFEERLKAQKNKLVMVGEKISYADFGFAGFAKETFMASKDAALYGPILKNFPLLSAYLSELMKI